MTAATNPSELEDIRLEQAQGGAAEPSDLEGRALDAIFTAISDNEVTGKGLVWYHECSPDKYFMVVTPYDAPLPGVADHAWAWADGEDGQVTTEELF